MMPLDWVAVSLIVGVPYNWAVAILQCRLSDREPDLATLRSRAVTQIVLAVITSIAGVLAAMELTGLITLTAALLAAAFYLAYLPGTYWTFQYLTGRFK